MSKIETNTPAPVVEREVVARIILMSRKGLNEAAATAWMETYAENPDGLDELRIAVFSAYRDADAILALLNRAGAGQLDRATDVEAIAQHIETLALTFPNSRRHEWLLCAKAIRALPLSPQAAGEDEK